MHACYCSSKSAILLSSIELAPNVSVNMAPACLGLPLFGRCLWGRWYTAGTPSAASWPCSALTAWLEPQFTLCLPQDLSALLKMFVGLSEGSCYDMFRFPSLPSNDDTLAADCACTGADENQAKPWRSLRASASLGLSLLFLVLLLTGLSPSLLGRHEKRQFIYTSKVWAKKIYSKKCVNCNRSELATNRVKCIFQTYDQNKSRGVL
jgi:hypothetical protein